MSRLQYARPCRGVQIFTKRKHRCLSSAAYEEASEDNTVKNLTVRDLAYNYKTGKPSILESFEPPCIRNFSIIAHIDHGKSTLSDAILVKTKNITEQERKGKQQHLDTLQVERERGITVKAQTATMVYKNKYLLNLIDTPGHVDFSFEVMRSLASCQGAVLLVDSTKGIQAQTLSTYYAAEEAGLKIIPVVTKIDMPNAQIDDTILSIATTFNMEPEVVIATSARSGVGVTELLDAIVTRIPPPPTPMVTPARLRIIDMWFHSTRGVVCLVQCVDGCLHENERITTCQLLSMGHASGVGTGGEFNVQELGILTPTPLRTKVLKGGQVGYLIAGMKDYMKAILGDTVVRCDDVAKAPPVPLPLFQPSASALYASVFPMDGDNFESLQIAVGRLALNDASLEVEKENSITLGSGLRIGFLGVLHMEVFHQRLRDELNMPVLLTRPNVPYTLLDRSTGERTIIANLADWPSTVSQRGYAVLEPMVEATIITPLDCLGEMLTLLKDKRGTQTDTMFMDESRVVLNYLIPWAEVVTDFHDQAKNLSSGYASFTFKPSPFAEADLVKCDLTINGESVEALSFVCHRDKVTRLGRELTEKLKDVIPRQQFEVIIQARIGMKSSAKSRIAPYRKDVLTTKAGKTVGGGDVTRKKKLLEKQKEGKKRSKTVGNVQLTQEAFWSLLSRK